jgi:AraC-like DNA-binding protein
MLVAAAHRDVPSGATLWPAALILWGPGAVSSAHSHHSVELMMALAGHLRIRPRPGARWRLCGAVLIARDVSHEVDARNATVLFGFIDPEIELAAVVADTLEPNLVPFSNAVVARWRRALGDPRTLEASRVDAWFRSDLLRDSPPRRIHPAVRRVLHHLRRHDGLDRRHASLERLADVAELSTSRLMHVFTESVGIPLRPYVLWLRVQRAAGALASGSSATEAAHMAGFADAPHLTRTCRHILGMTPRDLSRQIQGSREVRLDSAAGSQIMQDMPVVRSLP